MGGGRVDTIRVGIVACAVAGWVWMSAQVRLSVPRTTTGAGREDDAVSGADAVGTAAASAEPTMVRIMPMTTSSTRTYTTARTRRC